MTKTQIIGFKSCSILNEANHGYLPAAMVFMLMAILLFIPGRLHSSTPLRFQHLSLDDGLSQSSVQCILQDSEGFIWIGTQNGLNKYDGIRFTVYLHDPYREQSVANNIILSLKEDCCGYIWVGTQGGGLSRYDKRKDVFQPLTRITTDPQAGMMKNIWSLSYSCKGHLLWIGTDRGLYCWNTADTLLTCYSSPEGPLARYSNVPILCLYQDKTGQVWIGTAGLGLIRFDPATGLTVSYLHSPGTPASINHDIIWSFMEDHAGKLWIGTEGGICQYDPYSDSFLRYPYFPFRQTETALYSIWAMLEDHSGIVWAGSSNGLLKINPNTGTTEILRHEPYNPHSLSNNTVWTLLLDSTSTIWAGTNKGLNLIAPERIKFGLYGHNPDDPLSLPESPVYAVHEDHLGTIWVGTDGEGLCALGATGWQRFRNAPANPVSLSGNRVWSILEDSSHELWIGTYGNGLNHYNRERSTFTRYMYDPVDPSSLPNDRVIVIMEDRQGILWLGTRGGGLARMDRANGTFRSFQPDVGLPLSIQSNTIISLLEDRHGRFWIGTFEGGLSMFDRQGEVFHRFTDTTGRPVLADNCDVWSILEDQSGVLWVGTSTGLYMVTHVNELTYELTLRHFTIEDGLPNNMIIGLMEDSLHNIWITTFNGISQLRRSLLDHGIGLFPSEESSKPFFRNYDVNDGLQSNEFNQGAFFRGNSGRLYAGGIQGLNIFDPLNVKDFTVVPPVVFTGLRISYQPVSVWNDRQVSAGAEETDQREGKLFRMNNEYFISDAIPFLKRLYLSYRQNVLTFEFASLDFLDPRRNHYACRMEGFEDNWLFLGNTNSITYTNLDPGEYILHIIGTNSDGVWNNEGAELTILIAPPFWKTAWFIVPTVLAGIGLMALILYFVVKRQRILAKRKADQEKEIATLQLKSIKNQINPHFTFNAINTIGSLIYSEDPDTTYDYFTKFSKMIRSSLKNTDRIYISLEEELDFVRTYLDLEKVRFKQKFDYSIQASPDVDLAVHVPKMVIQTYAENAIKHGLMHKTRGGKLTIDITRKSGRLVLVITDNGVGRQKAAELSKHSTHRGLQIINQFYEIHNRLNKEKIIYSVTDLYDAGNHPAGTQVRIILPPNVNLPEPA